MTKHTSALVAVLIFGLSAQRGADASPQETSSHSGRFVLSHGDVWIEDVTLVSPERSAPLPHAHVVARSDRIAYAGAQAPAGTRSGVTVIDGKGRYLAPGLIDGHVHLADVPGISDAAPHGLAEAYYRQMPRSYVYFGFTAVVDLNVVDRESLNRVRAAAIGPDVFDCGNALALANGYPMNYLPPAIRFDAYPNFLYDPRQASAIPSKYPPEDHTPEADVRRVASGGAVCIKGHFEPGFDPKAGKLPVPTVAMMQQVHAAAHERGLPFLLHANSLDAHRFAVAAGVDAVAHGLWNWPPEDGTPEQNALKEPPQEVREVLDAERQAAIAYMPTMRVITGLTDLFRPEFLKDPRLKEVLPANLIAWYGTTDGQWFARQMAGEFDGLPPARIHDILAGKREGSRALKYVANHGGRILFGTDTPSAPTYANPPGYNGYLELREMEAAGITPARILTAATIDNAKFFHIDDRYGTIEPGKLATLLLLRENPLTSTAAFDTLDTVILKGRVIPRRSLATSY